MPGTLEQLLGVRHLSDVVRTFWDEPHQRIFTDLFKKGREMKFSDGNVAEWDEQRAHRHLAPFVGHSSPAVSVAATDFVNRQMALAHVKVYKQLDANRLFKQRAYGELGPNAQAYLMGELKDLVQLVERTVEYACGRVLQTGGLVVTPATVPGSTLTFTYNPGIQALAFTADWGGGATAIVSDEIPRLHAAYTQASGRVARQAIYNDVTERDIKGNTQVEAYVREVFAAKALADGHVDSALFDAMKLGGMQWLRHVGVYVPQGGAATRYMDTDRISILPGDEELSEVLAFAQGSGLVPAGPFSRAAEGGEALVQNAQPGIYSYAVVSTDPVGVTIYVGLPFLPIVLHPAGAMIFTSGA